MRIDTMVAEIDTVDTYKETSGRLELYSLLEEGLDQVENGKTRPSKEVMESIRKKMGF